MIKVKKYKLYSNKIKKKFKILLIGDIHLWDDYNKILINNMIEKAKVLNPDIILICGDLIDEFRYLKKFENEKYLLQVLNKLSDISDVFIVLGSHDFMNQKKLKTGNISSESILYWHKMIKNNNNLKIHLLDNEIYETSNYRIIGYNQSRNYYIKQENGDVLIKEMNENFNDLKEDKYTILMCHSPLKINEKTLEQIKIINSVDLILSGHMHDGLLFPFFKKLPTTIGLISPEKKLFPANTRGRKELIINNKKIVLIITGGIMKFSSTAPKFLQKLNCLYHNDMDIIEFDNVKS